jgi:hypothetical protein
LTFVGLLDEEASRPLISNPPLRGIRRTVGAAPARKAPVLAETSLMASEASATVRCYCWASLARFGGRNSWRSTCGQFRALT